jgi:hypothetical protein
MGFVELKQLTNMNIETELHNLAVTAKQRALNESEREQFLSALRVLAPGRPDNLLWDFTYGDPHDYIFAGLPTIGQDTDWETEINGIYCKLEFKVKTDANFLASKQCANELRGFDRVAGERLWAYATLNNFNCIWDQKFFIPAFFRVRYYKHNDKLMMHLGEFQLRSFLDAFFFDYDKFLKLTSEDKEIVHKKHSAFLRERNHEAA